MSLWSSVNGISACHVGCPEPLKHLPSHGKCASITAIDHGAGDHGCTRAKIRQPVEIDVVKNSHAVRRHGPVVECPELLVVPMLCAQAGGNLKDFFASRWWDKYLHAREISPAALRAVPLNSPTCGLHIPAPSRCSRRRIPVTQVHVPVTGLNYCSEESSLSYFIRGRPLITPRVHIAALGRHGSSSAKADGPLNHRRLNRARLDSVGVCYCMPRMRAACAGHDDGSGMGIQTESWQRGTTPGTGPRLTI
jgi:hypothetical protein